MPTPSVKNVGAAKPAAVGGGVYYGPLTQALPTDATTALNAAFKALGYVGEDGIRPAIDTTINKVKAFGGDTVAALLADEARAFEFTLIEAFSDEVNKFLYRTANVTVTAATASVGTKTYVQDKGGKPDQCVLIFDLKHGNKKRRVVVPIADPVITGEEPYVDGSLMAYTVTVEALKNTAGVRVFDYLENDDTV